MDYIFNPDLVLQTAVDPEISSCEDIRDSLNRSVATKSIWYNYLEESLLSDLVVLILLTVEVSLIVQTFCNLL